MEPVDVLIVTAVPEEYAAVLAAGGGAGAWETVTGSLGLDVALLEVAVEGGALRIAVTQALGMGGANAVIAAASLVQELEVRCLAMCGVCAGRRGQVELGDVIVADRVWEYDTGKRKVEVVDGERVARDQGDIEMYRLHPPAWKQAAERFVIDREAVWLKLRPRSYEAQGDWILERVLRGADPVGDPAGKTQCADFEKALDRLWKRGLLEDGTLTLTAAGRKHIQRVLLVNRNALPEAKAFKVHVGPIASGSRVMQDGEVFARLSESVRKVLGVDMEAAAMEALAHVQGLDHSVVMKAVMDHADADKSDNFKTFAARASAECLLAFVRQQVPPRGTREDPVLIPGTSESPPLAGPAALLNARHHVVPFYGRDDVLDEMRRWCESGNDVRVRLVHAAGGMGKTRLAIELCERMSKQGWRAGFVREGAEVAQLLESTQPALAVIDYAESRQDLGAMLKRIAGRCANKALRVVLLARNADEWWTDLLRSDGSVGDLLRHQEPLQLPSITADRVAIFREAAKAFAKEDYKGVVPSLADPRYERVLYVHAAALVASRGQEVNADALMEDTLDHEERFWREQLDRVAVNDMRQVVAALTLKDGVGSAAEARALVVLVCGAPDKKMALLLRDLYPGTAPKYVGGLEPDLLGEAMVWRALNKEGAGAGPYLDRVFEGADGQALRTGFTVLGRLSEDRKEADGWIARVLGRDVAGRAMGAFAAAKAVGERTAHAALGMELAQALEREGTIELAERLAPLLPNPQRTVSLREVGRWVTQKQLGHMPEGSRLEARARLLNDLSGWQSVLEQRAAALASMRGAMDIYRKLVALRPEASLPSLAMSLSNLGMMQSALGQRQAALASAQEAADIYRKLAALRPEAFLPSLAMSLNNLGDDQSSLGQHQMALNSTQEAVDIRRKLAQRNPDAFLPDLATSLHNLGNMQRELGQGDTALALSKEAVALRRTLAGSHPDAFLPSLAKSLNNLGAAHGELGQGDAALACIMEATDICRKLAESHRDAFLLPLALSLNNLSVAQSGLGQYEAARASSQEALDTIWPLFLHQPGAFDGMTSVILSNLRSRIAALGQPPPAELLQRIRFVGDWPGEPNMQRARVRDLLADGEVKLKLGKEAGLDDLQHALDLARVTGDDVLLADAYLANAHARYRRQDYEDARMYYLSAAMLFQKHGAFARYALAYKLLVALSLEVGRRDDAVRYYRSAEHVLQEGADTGALSDLQSLASRVEQVERR